MLGVCSSLQDQQYWFLNQLILSSYERDMIKILKLKIGEFCRILWVFFKIQQQVWREGDEFKRRREKKFSSQSPLAMSPSRGGRVGLTGAEGSLGRGAHGLPHGQALWPHALQTSLTRSFSSSAHILGIRTLILNLFSDYEPWVPHAWLRLHNFEKWLRNHLGIRRWSQHNK